MRPETQAAVECVLADSALPAGAGHDYKEQGIMHSHKCQTLCTAGHAVHSSSYRTLCTAGTQQTAGIMHSSAVRLFAAPAASCGPAACTSLLLLMGRSYETSL